MISLNDIYNVVPKNVIQSIFNNFELDLIDGDHGFFHWSRVIENGKYISEQNNANLNIIIAFGFFHDCKRENDTNDPKHGFRGAEIMYLYKDELNLTEEEFNKVYEACEGHTDEMYHDDLDISTCWDSDRLDLMRVGIYPEAEFLNNHIAQQEETIELRSFISENEQNPE